MDTTRVDASLATRAGVGDTARTVLRLVPQLRLASRRPVVLDALPWCVVAGGAGAAATSGVVGRSAGVLVGVLLAVAATIDVREHRLPNSLVGAAFAAALGGAAAGGDMAVVAAAGGALVAGGLLLLVHLSRGVGMGDVKAAAAIGASLGTVAWWAAPTAIAVAAFVAASYGAVKRVRRLPFGPALVAGWAATGLVTRWWR